MTSVTSYTAARMKVIEDSAIVDGDVIGDNLILRRRDGATIDAGNVRGPTGTPGVSEATFLAETALFLPVGVIVDYMGTTNPPRWLPMQGQTIVDGQTLYPALWALLPASMKSGANILMPDTRNRVTVGYNSSDADFNAIGKMGGSKTQILDVAHIPIHAHSINHDHDGASTGFASTAHHHSMSHDHDGALTGGASANHSHESAIAGTAFSLVDDGENLSNIYAAGTDYAGKPGSPESLWGNTGIENADHFHSVNLPEYVGITSAENVDHFHTVNLPNFAGTSGNAGSGAAFSIMQSYITFLKIIKAV